MDEPKEPKTIPSKHKLTKSKEVESHFASKEAPIVVEDKKIEAILEEERNPFDKYSLPLSILVASLLISLSVLMSGGIIKQKGSKISFQLQSATPQQQVNAPISEERTDLGPISVSVDDDPLLGDKNAPVTLIEFSDYECPFCKRHFDQTYSQIKNEYIDKGKVKLVFRDLPLPFHDPLATIEAIAANCAKEQGGDSAYFKMHDEMFKQTTSNGKGLTKEQIYEMAGKLGLNSNNLKACVEAEKHKDEVQKDLADAENLGQLGTPTFFIGKANNGVIEGVKQTPDEKYPDNVFYIHDANNKIVGARISGALPFSSFQSLINQFLN